MKFNTTFFAVISLFTAIALARPVLVARAEQRWLLTNVVITDYLGRNMVNPADSGRNEDRTDNSRDGEPEEGEEDQELEKSLGEQAQELATLRLEVERLRAERLDRSELADGRLAEDTPRPRTRPEEVPEQVNPSEEVPEQETEEIPEQITRAEEVPQRRPQPEVVPEKNGRSRKNRPDQRLAQQTRPQRPPPERTAPETKKSGDEEYLRFDPSIRFETRSAVVKRAGFTGVHDRPRGVTVTFDLRDDAAQETLTTCSLAGDLPLNERAPCENPEYVTWYDHTPFTSVDSYFAVTVEYKPKNKFLAVATKITGRFVVDNQAILDQYQSTFPQGPLTYLNPIDIAKNVAGFFDSEGEAPS